jgi:hypothetical protein
MRAVLAGGASLRRTPPYGCLIRIQYWWLRIG